MTVLLMNTKQQSTVHYKLQYHYSKISKISSKFPCLEKLRELWDKFWKQENLCKANEKIRKLFTEVLKKKALIRVPRQERMKFTVEN
jgi:hypothetical protein